MRSRTAAAPDFGSINRYGMRVESSERHFEVACLPRRDDDASAVLQCLGGRGSGIERQISPISKEGMRSIDIHAHITPQCVYQTHQRGESWHGLPPPKGTSGSFAANGV